MRLLLILGPPAVGKMTVGRAVAERSSYRLFHNHHSIEMLLDVFDYGTPPFRTLNTEIRTRVIEEAAASGADLVFTFVMGMDEDDEAAYLERLAAPYGDRVAVVELVADLDTRLVRNRTEHRLAEKRSKRDVEWSDANVRELEADYRMTSEPGRDAPGERLLARWPHLVVDNTDLDAEEVADRIGRWLVTLG
ncbi:AAA family ATPase [Nocardioides hwasunensis]|uniref:AAA family ATPase n=1 Tax=Nocardioides hwasunensis TaxID=397258 RepID=A0ABR8MKT8_9ACTN|nr:AAA family ATPase [Nocardioides hwasunensis]MBD3915382.1 AAA family ATPase [Nocardioides hwasunensis]